MNIYSQYFLIGWIWQLPPDLLFVSWSFELRCIQHSCVVVCLSNRRRRFWCGKLSSSSSGRCASKAASSAWRWGPLRCFSRAGYCVQFSTPCHELQHDQHLKRVRPSWTHSGSKWVEYRTSSKNEHVNNCISCLVVFTYSVFSLFTVSGIMSQNVVSP